MSADRTRRILVVDDEPAVRAMVARALREEGYEVVGVGDGQAGLTAAETADVSYDLVVTNSYMPHLSGEQLIAELRRLYPGLPILHLDDLSRPSELPDDIPNLTKPFSLDRLIQAVRGLLGEQGTPHGAA
jgi:DNA-binding response OmpR family regulator